MCVHGDPRLLFLNCNSLGSITNRKFPSVRLQIRFVLISDWVSRVSLSRTMQILRWWVYACKFMLVDLEALLLDTESELDFLKISKFCKHLRFGQYFPYEHGYFKKFTRLGVSLKMCVEPSWVLRSFWKCQKWKVEVICDRYWCPEIFLNPSEQKVRGV